MSLASKRSSPRGIAVGIAVLSMAVAAQGQPSEPTPVAPSTAPAAKVPSVSADIALSALIALSDGYLQKLADSLVLVAGGDAVRSGDWERIRGPLQEVARLDVDATLWFARPDGTYWTLARGRERNTLASRPYLPKLMAGHEVLGDLMVSKSTGKSVAIVAVPIRGRDGAIVGALGASVYLDKLSARLARELRLGPGTIFYSFDARPLLGVVWDPSLILIDPRRISPALARVFDDMLERHEGIERYTFRGKVRTVVFRRSDVTGWWYALGVVDDTESAPSREHPISGSSTR